MIYTSTAPAGKVLKFLKYILTTYYDVSHDIFSVHAAQLCI